MSRHEELLKLQSYIDGVDKEITMILQSLQWDRKKLMEGPTMVMCKYDRNHKIPLDKRDKHEEKCFLKINGYSEEDKMLPDPLDANANTVVKLSTDDIKIIIDNASKTDPMFKKGTGCEGPQPLTAERLQATYTADERRAIHDAVVQRVPSCYDLTDLALPSGSGEQQKSRVKSYEEVLAELRDMRRRRTKYRGAAKTRNYSDVLRDIITTQMEHYSEVHTESSVKIEQEENSKYQDNIHSNNDQASNNHYSRDNNRDMRHKTKDRYEQETTASNGKKIDNDCYNNEDKRYNSKCNKYNRTAKTNSFSSSEYHNKIERDIKPRIENKRYRHNDKQHSHDKYERAENSSHQNKRSIDRNKREERLSSSSKDRSGYNNNEKSSSERYEHRKYQERPHSSKYNDYYESNCKHKEKKERYYDGKNKEYERRSERYDNDGKYQKDSTSTKHKDYNESKEKYKRYYDGEDVDELNGEKRKKHKKDF